MRENHVLKYIEGQAFLNVKEQWEKDDLIEKARTKRLFLKALEEDCPDSLAEIRAEIWWHDDNDTIKQIRCYDDNGKYIRMFPPGHTEDFIYRFCWTIAGLDDGDELRIFVKDKRFTKGGADYDFNGDKIDD